MRNAIYKINHNKEHYRIIGFNNLKAVKDYIRGKFDIPRMYILPLRNGVYHYIHWFDVKIICLNDIQKEKLHEASSFNK